MRRLTTYLTGLFSRDAAILFAVTCLLLWLMSCLRTFDIVAVRGQSFGTLAINALYTMPPLALSFFYICVGVGLVRGLAALQASHELHIIHSSGSFGGLWRAAGLTLGLAVAVVTLLAHVIEPMSSRQLNELNAEVAADLVSSSLQPGRFTQVTPGVVLLIGGRENDGDITRFFADDRRDAETRHTYIAQSARVLANGEDYFLRLSDGVLQYTQRDGRFSEVRFEQYEISVESLSQSTARFDPLDDMTSFELLHLWLVEGDDDPDILETLLDRSVDILRVIGLGLVALALAAFPSGNRTRLRLPLEAVVIIVSFIERGISGFSPWGEATGAMLLIAVSVGVLAVRLWPRRPIAEAMA
jgi:lipopolysaccharide export system permease protein